MLSGVINRLTEYVKLKAEQVKLEVMARMASVLSQVLVFSLMAFLGLFLIFFLSFALGSYLNELMSSQYLGHLIVAGAYFIVLLIIGLLAKTGKIQNWLETIILKAGETEEDDEDE